jgi:hypothetical protein
MVPKIGETVATALKSVTTASHRKAMSTITRATSSSFA